MSWVSALDLNGSWQTVRPPQIAEPSPSHGLPSTSSAMCRLRPRVQCMSKECIDCNVDYRKCSRCGFGSWFYFDKAGRCKQASGGFASAVLPYISCLCKQVSLLAASALLLRMLC